MKLLDTNALDYMVKQGIKSGEEFCITPDIQDEFEAWHDTKLPKTVRNLFADADFDRAGYLGHYRRMLNKYGQRSFYNMSGFGDISVLAVLMIENEAAGKILPGLAEDVVVVSNDWPLTKKIEGEFDPKIGHAKLNVVVVSPQSFFKGKTA
jgi:hypothetical protein